MARKVITVCDICESAQGIRQWEVKDIANGAKKKVELCVTHSTPFARLFEPANLEIVTPEHTDAAAKSASRTRGRSRTPVVDE